MAHQTRRRTAAVALVAALAGYPNGAASADISEAYYDPARDELVVEIAYRGTVPGHRFRLVWGKCNRSEGPPHDIAARIIDMQGDDIARVDFRIRARFRLDDLPCRPAAVTLRMGRVSHETVRVPEASGTAQK